MNSIFSKPLTSYSKKIFFSRDISILILIIFISLSLRFFQLGEESLWGDELASLSRVSEIPESGLHINRILYFVFLKLWILFGKSEAWLRFPSVIFGVTSVFLLYLLGTRLFDKATGLIAAGLLALSPLAIFHSQEVRMYMLSVLICLIGTLLLVRYCAHGTFKSFLGWFFIRILAVLTTPINILLLIPDSIILIRNTFIKFNLKEKPRYLLSFLAVVILLSSIFLTVFSPSIEALLKFIAVKQTPPGLEITFKSFIGGIARLTVWPLMSPFSGLSYFYNHFFNLYGICLIMLLMVSLIAKQSIQSKLWVFLWGPFTLAILFLICKYTSPMLWGVPRYSIFIAPYIFILIALGIIQIWKWKRQVALVLISIYSLAVIGSLWQYYTSDTDEDWRSVFETIHIQEQPNDALAIFPPYSKMAADYYYKGDSQIFLIEDTGSYPDKAKINTIFDNLDSNRKFNHIKSKKSRLWFILNFSNKGFSNTEREVFQHRIEQNFNIISHSYFSGVELMLVNVEMKIN